MLRPSFVQILFAGLFQSVVVSAMKHPFFSPRFWQGTVVSFILSTLGGWFVAFLICRVAANEIDSRFTYDLWTGMITSVFIATIAAGLFPRHVCLHDLCLHDSGFPSFFRRTRTILVTSTPLRTFSDDRDCIPKYSIGRCDLAACFNDALRFCRFFPLKRGESR